MDNHRQASASTATPPLTTTRVVWTPRDLNIAKECARRRKQAEQQQAKASA